MDWVIDTLQILIDKKIRPTKIVIENTGAMNLQTYFKTKTMETWLMEMRIHQNSLNITETKKVWLTQKKAALENGSTLYKAISQDDVWALECLNEQLKKAKVELEADGNLKRTFWKLKLNSEMLEVVNEDKEDSVLMTWDNNIDFCDDYSEIVEFMKEFK